MPTPMNLDDTVTTAAQQPLPFALIDGQPAPSPAADDPTARLAKLRQVATTVMGDRAEGWIANPTPALGGLAPVDLAADSEEGCQEAIRHLIATHPPRGAGDG